MEIVACDLCGATQDVPMFFKAEEDCRYRIAQCTACGLVYVNPRTFAEEHDGYFRGPYLATIEEHGKLRPTIACLYDEILTHLETYLHPARLLDVGCAMGHFMDFARQRGWDVTGVECSRYAAAWGRDHFGLRIHAMCDLTRVQFPSDYCDAAVLVEVVEHLPSPRLALNEVLRILKPGGILCLTTPNFASYRSLLLRENWDVIIPSGHLYYFTGQTLQTLLQRVGFTGVVELTKSATFEDDLAYATETGKLPLDAAAIEELQARLEHEDSSKISNGRSEGLVLCAQKPLAPGLQAARRSTFSITAVEGKLVQARPMPGVTGERRVYYVHSGVKHWVTSTEWIAHRGLRFPDDLSLLAPHDLSAIPEGPAI